MNRAARHLGGISLLFSKAVSAVGVCMIELPPAISLEKTKVSQMFVVVELRLCSENFHFLARFRVN